MPARTGSQYRDDLVALMARTVADQQAHGNWTYLAVRPQEVISSYTLGQRVRADCSNGCRMLAHITGVPDDPAGLSYAPYGNSSSIWVHLHHILFAEVKPGDIFTFGYHSGEHHASMAWERYGPGDHDWWVWNHGTQGQPAKKRLVDEMNWHSGMAVTACLLNVPPDPPPTPDDLLRARKGYYSWVAWKLGEGPWKGKGKANPAVRPDVPRVIPPVWWKQYAQFLLNRKKPNPPTSQP